MRVFASTEGLRDYFLAEQAKAEKERDRYADLLAAGVDACLRAGHSRGTARERRAYAMGQANAYADAAAAVSELNPKRAAAIEALIARNRKEV